MSAPEPYRKCDGHNVICPTLRKRLGDAHSRGLGLQSVMNLKTGADCEPILLYKTSAKDGGIILNYCPWCGGKLNRRYQAKRK